MGLYKSVSPIQFFVSGYLSYTKKGLGRSSPNPPELLRNFVGLLRQAARISSVSIFNFLHGVVAATKDRFRHVGFQLS